jgi:hypothetical protein
MALAAFDTLEFVEELEKSGIPEKQAKAISAAMRKAQASSDVATKADLEKFGTELRHEMKESASALRQEMSNMKFELLKWMVGFSLTNIAFLAGIFWKIMSIPGVY